MKRFLFTFFILSAIILPSGVAGAATEAISQKAQTVNYFGPPLCRPGMVEEGSCLFSGPAQTVAQMREDGFPYPSRDLPAAPPPDDLAKMPVFVARINFPNDEPAPIYGTYEDAIAGENPVRQIAPGTLRYVSYVYRQDHEGKKLVQLTSGEWMRAAPAAYSDFQGLSFFDNPRNDFGWVIDQTPGYLAPSFDAAASGNTYNREDVLQVYSSVEAEGYLWHQIAPDEWINDLKIGVVFLKTSPPEGVEADRWIELDLHQQTLAVYEDGRLLFATIVATGVESFYTQPGVFQIDEKKPLETMQGAFEVGRSDFYYLEDVPWTMYFDQARALHAAYWRTYFGYPQSHGCVNLSPGDAKWLFEWADEGDFVWVHDPSGETPTDPDFYGRGAP